MIEKRQEIGVPLQCAESTNEATFETIGIKPSKRYLCSEIVGADLYSPDGTHFQMTPDNEKGFILDRKVFDKHLAIESAKTGTDIMLKTTVKDLIIKEGNIKGVVAKHMGKPMEIEAYLVIAADGVESNVARMAGLNSTYRINDICSCAQYKMVGIDVEPNYMQFYFGHKIAPGGYLWIFPNENGEINVGIGIRNTKETAYKYLHNFISNLSGTLVNLMLVEYLSQAILKRHIPTG